MEELSSFFLDELLTEGRLENASPPLTAFPNWKELWHEFFPIFLAEWEAKTIHEIGKEEFLAFSLQRFLFFLENLDRDFAVRLASYDDPEQTNDFQVLEISLEDRPFIVSSLYSYLTRKGLQLKAFVHPIFSLQTDPTSQQITAIKFPKQKKDRRRSFVIALLSKEGEGKEQEIEQELREVFQSMMVAVDDYPKVRIALEEILQTFELRGDNSIVETEQQALLKWYLQGNILAFGFSTIKASFSPESFDFKDFQQPLGYLALWQKESQGKDDKRLLALKAALQLFVHSHLKNSFLDLNLYSSTNRYQTLLVALHKFEDANQQSKILLIPCIFSNQSYETSIQKIPIVRLKLNGVIDSFGYLEGSYDYKAALDFFNQFPRQEIFRLDRDEMRALWQKVKALYRVDAVLVFPIKAEDTYTHLSILIPEHSYSQDQDAELLKLFEQHSKSPAHHSYGFFFRQAYHFHIIAILDKETAKNFSLARFEEELRNSLRSWDDKVLELLRADPQSFPAHYFHRTFLKSIPLEYKDLTRPQQALGDLKELYLLEQSSEQQGTKVTVQQLTTEKSLVLVFSKEDFPLHKSFHKLESLKLEVYKNFHYNLTFADKSYSISRYYCQHEEIKQENWPSFQTNLATLLIELFQEKITIDPFWAIIAKASLSLSSIQILRLYRNFLVQVVPQFSLGVVNRVALDYPETMEKLFAFFQTKFQPSAFSAEHSDEQKEAVEKARQDAKQALVSAKTTLDDHVLKGYWSLIDASLRTNFYLPSNNSGALAIKLDCAKAEVIPSPKPFYEIYVFGESFEGVHLRDGKIARGGIRHSDRKEDFRQEVLDLMRTQSLKNVVIVPVGAKGGFIIKNPPKDLKKEAGELVAYYYENYIRQLLSVTDNLVEGKVVRDPQLVIYDEDDPYLVVAADKGTANFSDLANGISLENNFWLGDAFASGGSKGYSHKKLGITARGAFECAKTHFKFLSQEIEQPFRVVGIGDMSGDVFGNAMLLSRQIKLIGAFNHQHIFLEADPDPEVSYEERKRLFALPRSSWRDYNPDLIRQGGVFDRFSKAIDLSPRLQELFKTSATSFSGEQMISALLKLDVDMLYNGGIGVYVKSTKETNEEVGDKANAGVRINADSLRAKMVVEGGNLGVTPLARIEFSSHQGLIYNDATDNSAGVDMSDHEVNLKILLKQLLQQGLIASQAAKEQLLEDLSQEMVELCLEDNRQQAYRLTLDSVQSNQQMHFFMLELKHLEKAEGLHRQQNAIPDDVWFFELQKAEKPIPRPILAVFMSHLKNYVYNRLLDSELPDIPEMGQKFVEYFPPSLQRKFDLKATDHPLKRQIIATCLTNQFVNHNGCYFLSKTYTAVAQKAADIMYATFIVEELFPYYTLRTRLLEESSAAHYKEVLELVLSIEAKTYERVVWLLCNFSAEERNFDLVKLYKKSIEEYIELPKSLSSTFSEEEKQSHVAKLASLGLPQDLAESYSAFVSLKNPLEVSHLKILTGLDFDASQKVLEQVNALFFFDVMSRILIDAKGVDAWQVAYIGQLLIKLNRIKNSFLKVLGQYYAEQKSFDGLKSYWQEHHPELILFEDEWRRFYANRKDIFSGISLFLERFEALLNLKNTAPIAPFPTAP